LEEPASEFVNASGEADKIRCGQRHFEALGVPFDVVVTAGEV
jgi:hypothetical protein